MEDLLDEPLLLLLAVAVLWIILVGSLRVRQDEGTGASDSPAGDAPEDLRALSERVAALEKTLRKVNRRDLMFAKRMRRRLEKLGRWWVVLLGTIGTAIVSVVVHQVGEVLLDLIKKNG